MIAAAPAALAQVPMAPGMPPPAPTVTAPPPMIVPTTPGPAGVAAIVNGKKIYRFQVAAQALSLSGPQILNTMIVIEIINQEAAKQHIVVTPAQVDAQLALVQQRAAAQVPGGLAALLSQRNETLAAFKQQLLPQMEAEALVAKTLPPAPLPVRYHARHLLIMTAPADPMTPGAAPPHTDAEALALIAKAQAELKAGKSFAEVANEYTEDPSGKGKGGDLGIIDAGTPFDPNFLKAALALKPGEITPTPVKSQYGYHLIEIDSTSAAPLPSDTALYAAAAAAARRQQVQNAVPGYVQSLRAKAKVVDYLAQ